MYSNKRINRAGKLCVKIRDALLADTPEREIEARFGEAVAPALDAVDWWRSRHAAPLARVNVGLRYYVKEIHDEPPTQRLKKFSTIVDKLAREPTMALTTMEDIGGVRAILPNQDAVDLVVARLRQNWGNARAGRSHVHRIRDYVRKPKEDGYRAMHVIVKTRGGIFVEIQLRTPWQDRWAQSVEFDTRELGVGLKFGLGPADLRDYYVMVAELVGMREENIEPPEGFLEELRERQQQHRAYYDARTKGSSQS